MSQTDSTRHASIVPPTVGPIGGTRVNPAHLPPNTAPPDEAAPAIVEELPAQIPLAATTVEQVRLQAVQLAAHLQRQASTVDHREGELNARLAAMEDQVRAARLWLAEENQELEAHKADLDRREQELISHAGQSSSVPTRTSGRDEPTHPPTKRWRSAKPSSTGARRSSTHCLRAWRRKSPRPAKSKRCGNNYEAA